MSRIILPRPLPIPQVSSLGGVRFGPGLVLGMMPVSRLCSLMMADTDRAFSNSSSLLVCQSNTQKNKLKTN